MSQLIRFAKLAATIPLMLAVTALFLMMAMTFADVVMRSALNTPIEAATELTRIMMAIVVFSALPMVSGRAEHITVDLLDPIFPDWMARWRDAIVSLVCGAMLWLPAERVGVLAERARDYGDLTEYLGIPQFYIGWFIAVFTYLTASALVGRGLILIFAPSAVEELNPETTHD